MNPLEKMKTWLATYEGFDVLGKFQVDYIDQTPVNGSIFPSGMVEIERRTDIFGNTTAEKQYNFALYAVFNKSPGDEEGAAENANWLMDFQEWVQTQSITGQAPVFGDVPREEKIMAQNGVLHDATDAGVGTYVVQLSVRYKEKFKEENNKWLI